MAQSAGKQVTVQGRLVYVLGGDLWKGAVKKERRTGQPVIDRKTNQQVVEYGFGLAVPKKLLIDPATNQWLMNNMGPGGPGEFYAAIQSEAQSVYTNGIPRDFAWKFKWDYDMDKNNKPYGDREGYKDCIVLNCSTRIPFSVFKHQGAYIQINEGVNAGDWVTVQLSIKAHSSSGNDDNPGMYINPIMVLLNMKGDPIVSAGANPENAFGSAAPQAASWMTPAQNPAPQNFNQFANSQGPQPGGMPQMPGPGPQGPVSPNFNVLPQHHQPQGMPNANQMPGMPGMGQPQGQNTMPYNGQSNGPVPGAQMPGPQGGPQFGTAPGGNGAYPNQASGPAQTGVYGQGGQIPQQQNFGPAPGGPGGYQQPQYGQPGNGGQWNGGPPAPGAWNGQQ